MTLVLLIVQIILAVCLILIVLLQRSGSEGWSGLASSGGGSGVISKRSSANFLVRATAIIAALFMVNSLVLANIVSKKNKSSLIIEQVDPSSKDRKHKNRSLKEKSSSLPLAE